VAALVIQGVLIADHMAMSSPEGDGVFNQAIDPLMAEPAAGPEPSQAPSGSEPGMVAVDERDGQSAVCEPHLLRALEERSRELDAWSSQLADRARMLEVIEVRAAEQVQALKAQREALETVLASVEEGTEVEVTRLVKIYENMKPKEAARIFEAMPAEVAAGFIRRMNEGKSALVMGRLAAEHAYAITLAMANHPAPPAKP
jgi:flagellar motility protein MotE (MotC chaperone)